MKNSICRSSLRRKPNLLDAPRLEPADMHDDTDPFVFPERPDEAVAALNRFLEDFYTAFQNHYFAQIHRWYHRQPPDDDQLPLPLDLPF